ncbi:MAG: DUF5666 domain-containing protein [Candidatus Taylorbacteria bacterium]|nr:DUF5666 domain-containing protein [Candidatus Taylorbacteria bacterium]
MIKNKKYIYTLAALLASATLLTTSVSAQTDDSSKNPGQSPNGQRVGMMGKNGFRPAVAGKVTAINGTTLTVTSMKRPMRIGEDKNSEGTVSTNQSPATSVVFTVDGTNATVLKNNATSTFSAIAVGDSVTVQGTVTGTNVVATTIRDGLMPAGNLWKNGEQDGKELDKNGRPRNASSTIPVSPITGNGQPIIAGTVASISGSSITVNTKSNVVYIVDVTNAKIVEGQNTIALSNVAVGDSVIVQGTVNGTSVVASSIIDGAKPVQNSTNNAPENHPGFFGSIGNFFKNIFGF